MPDTRIIIFCNDNGKSPLMLWFENLPMKAANKYEARIERLAKCGIELQMPYTKYLKQEIWELRFRVGKLNYRILYSFVKKSVVLLSHGIIKEGKVPEKEIKRAVDNRKKYIENPSKHAYRQ